MVKKTKKLLPMKTKLLLLSFLMLFTITTNYAQVSFTQAGIAVQGIVRDNNNTAITDGEPITLEFTIYYDDAGTSKNAYYERVPNIIPDAFGVFSYVMNVLPESNPLFSNYNMKLKIETQIGNNLTVISDEPLKYVPYAISANNGVPTGAIMPFVGAANQVPTGWALCNGDLLPSTATKLIALLNSNNTPNLGGMFLRGAGINRNGGSFAGNDGPDVNETQGDQANLANHNHRLNLTTGDRALTQDQIEPRSGVGLMVGNGWGGTVDSGGGTGGIHGGGFYKINGRHNHEIQGSTENKGITAETRPVNYGVNYIIKL
jgi:hypothetical protein